MCCLHRHIAPYTVGSLLWGLAPLLPPITPSIIQDRTWQQSPALGKASEYWTLSPSLASYRLWTPAQQPRVRN